MEFIHVAYLRERFTQKYVDSGVEHTNTYRCQPEILPRIGATYCIGIGDCLTKPNLTLKVAAPIPFWGKG